jgi:hypothetical protein
VIGYVTHVIRSDFEMDDTGTVVVVTIRPPNETEGLSEGGYLGVAISPTSEPRGWPTASVKLAALGNLGVSQAGYWKQGECTHVMIGCKNSYQCALWRPPNVAVWDLEFSVNTEEQAKKVIDLLKKIAVYYPEGEIQQ